jgi:hypothetical protein
MMNTNDVLKLDLRRPINEIAGFIRKRRKA